MQTFLLIVIFILIVINLRQADELRDLERNLLRKVNRFFKNISNIKK